MVVVHLKTAFEEACLGSRLRGNDDVGEARAARTSTLKIAQNVLKQNWVVAQQTVREDVHYTGVVHGVFNASTRRALTKYRETR